MSANAAHFDDNQVPTIMGAIGTLGTADTAGTANSLPISVQAATGAVNVHLLTNDITIGGGTQFAEDAIHSSGAGGNIALAVRTDGGTALAADGDYHVLETDANGALRITGTVTTGAGTQAVRTIDGTVTRISTIGTLELGSMTNTGTNVNIVTGTVNVGTFVGNGGSIGVQGVGGTGVAAVGNPVLIGGVDSGGTTYRMLVDTTGNPQIDVITIPQVSVGTIPQVSVGTLPTLNLATGTITTGSLTNIAQVHNAGTLAAGANNIGDIDIATGTVTLLSTVTTLSNLTNGSVNILTGTIQNSGTTTGVGVVSNLTNGSINVLTGTVTSVTNLAGGTTQINPVPIPTILTFGTLGTAGGSFFATISAASGAGTKHYIYGVDIVMDSGTADVRVLAGSAIQGTGVLAGGKFPAGGGISPVFNPAFATGTNSEILYHFVGAGTAFITTRYWKGA